MTVTTNIQSVFCNLHKCDHTRNQTSMDLRDAYFGRAILDEANLSGAILEGVIFGKARLVYTDLRNANLKNTDLKEVHATGAVFSEADLTEADLTEAILNSTNFVRADLTNAFLCKATLEKSNLGATVLRGAKFRATTLVKANLMGADLSDADLTGADLSGACLAGANLQRVIGIGTKRKEINFAKKLLAKLESGEGTLYMDHWHGCKTTHCLAGWRFPNEQFPGQKASLECPTLAQYFFSEKEEAMAALRRVASGEESVFPS